MTGSPVAQVAPLFLMVSKIGMIPFIGGQLKKILKGWCNLCNDAVDSTYIKLIQTATTPAI